MILARQPFPDELAVMVRDIFEKNCLTSKLDDKHLKLRGRMTFAVLNGFSQDVAEYFREKFKEDIKNIYILNPERWKVVAELLGSLYASDDYIVSGKNFIEALEEIVLQQGIEIKKEFGEFVNAMAWWMPARLLDKVHKLRRGICW
ncbi:MAG: hypothetical protein QME73_10225 [Bacillota bacterium]|nr:hypothetical protein [Bacillota bacterium]